MQRAARWPRIKVMRTFIYSATYFNVAENVGGVDECKWRNCMITRFPLNCSGVGFSHSLTRAISCENVIIFMFVSGGKGGGGQPWPRAGMVRGGTGVTGEAPEAGMCHVCDICYGGLNQ